MGIRPDCFPEGREECGGWGPWTEGPRVSVSPPEARVFEVCLGGRSGELVLEHMFPIWGPGP